MKAALRTSDFDYSLPRELVAQTPTEPRDTSRLMVLSRSNGAIEHRHFHEIDGLLKHGDLLVFNNSRVIPARLYGHRLDTRGKVELLLLHRLGPGQWRCLVKPGRRFPAGMRFIVGRDSTSVAGQVLQHEEDGTRIVSFEDEQTLERVGHIPLPPYIREPISDPERYQTVYAQINGSAAAPTAGLHFTPHLLERLHQKGVDFAFVTLHIGLDTFRPVDEEDPSQHRLHSEYWEVEAETIKALNRARAENRRVVAVGTTTVRVLEYIARICPDLHPSQGSLSGWTDLFITPGHQFLMIDALITNFHLPRSTLLMLVSAFAGRDLVMNAYHEAIAHRYRFYSFGDAMVIV